MTQQLMETSEYQDMYHTEDRLWWYRGLREITLYQIRQAFPNGGRLLDAGCGTGKHLEFFQDHGFTTEGFDLSEDALEFCRQRGLNQVRIGSVTEIPYPDDSFEVVCCMDVIGMLSTDDQQIAVRELYRVLKPGGLLILNCAALEWLRSQHDEIGHLQTRHSKKTIQTLLTPEGYQVVFQKLTYRVFLLFPVMAAVKLVKKIALKFGVKPTSDQKVTPALLNEPLTRVQQVENWLLRRIAAPIGSSIFAAVKLVEKSVTKVVTWFTSASVFHTMCEAGVIIVERAH